MRVDFLLHGYTELRYILPIAERIGNHHEKRAFANRRTAKYNSVATLGTERMRSMLEARGVKLLDEEHPTGGDVIYSVEGVTPWAEKRGEYGRIVCLQHAFDYFNPRSHLDENSISVMWDNASAGQIREFKPTIRTYVPRVPTPFWNIEENLSAFADQDLSPESALVFYPDIGFTDEARSICEAISRAGLTPIIKQRSKHQKIQTTSGAIDVYDRIWYPSESIFLALGSRFSVGLGTGAYADICAAGIDFIDFDLPDYSRKYAKPTCSEFHTGDLANLDRQIRWVADKSRSRQLNRLCDDDIVDFFVSTAGEDLR